MATQSSNAVGRRLREHACYRSTAAGSQSSSRRLHSPPAADRIDRVRSRHRGRTAAFPAKTPTPNHTRSSRTGTAMRSPCSARRTRDTRRETAWRTVGRRVPRRRTTPSRSCSFQSRSPRSSRPIQSRPRHRRPSPERNHTGQRNRRAAAPSQNLSPRIIAPPAHKPTRKPPQGIQSRRPSAISSSCRILYHLPVRRHCMLRRASRHRCYFWPGRINFSDSYRIRLKLSVQVN